MTDITTTPAQIFVQVDGGVNNVLTSFDVPTQDGNKIFGSSIAYGVAKALKEQLDEIADPAWKRQIRDWLFPSEPVNNSAPKLASAFEQNVRRITGDLAELLVAKNESYGNSVLDPLRVFSKGTPEEQILTRIDDKLSRVARGHEHGDDDTIKDLLGYLVILLIAREQG